MAQESPAARHQYAELEGGRSNGFELEAGRRQQLSEFLKCSFATAQPNQHVQVGPREPGVVLAGAQPLRANPLHEKHPGARR